MLQNMPNGYSEGIMYQAKPIVENKFWIVEENGQKVGTIRKGHDITVTMNGESVGKCNTIADLKDQFGIELTTAMEVSVPKKPEKTENTVHGYPCKVKPYNDTYDLKRKLPLYTKTPKSQSFFCAGYYIIHFPTGWLPSYCPKLLTLGRNEFKGPYTTRLEMQEHVRKANEEA